MDRSRSSSHTWLAGGLVALLVVLAILQWRWSERLSDVEEARLESLLELGAAAINREVNGALLSLSFSLENPPVPVDDPSVVLRYWEEAADSADLVEAIYWVRPGPDPDLYRLEQGSVSATVWPERLTPWRRAVEVIPSLEAPSTSPRDTLTVRSQAHPPNPPALLLPIVSEQFLGLRFLLVVLDTQEVEEYLGSLVSRHLPGDGFQVRVVTTADSSVMLYDGAAGSPAFGSPDLDAGLLWNTFHKVSATGTPLEARPPDVIVGYDRGVRYRWRLLAQHRAGSIQAVTASLRRRQLAVAFGVLMVLGVAVALMATQARRQRALAEGQFAFVAGVTHELRTPLAVLRSAGENLAHGKVSAESVRRYGDIVRDEATRLADRVETILSYAGADSLRRSHIAVEHVVDDALERARPLLNETDVAVDPIPDLPALDVDPDAVATALRNLLANAALHGGSQVRVSASPASLGKAPAVSLTVSDDGPGFEPDLDPFAPFVRGRRAAENQTPGSGLGLSLVRRIAEAHGGTAKMGRAEEGGARVTLTLPVAP